MDSICEGRFDAAQDKVSVIARALGQEQSPACRAESLRLMARCAPIGCPVSVGAAIKHLQDNDPNVQLVAVDVLSRLSRTGDKNAVAALVSQLTGHMTKDPTQPGAFLNGTDPQKRSLANMARRPGDHSFRQVTDLRIAAVRALGAIGAPGDLRVLASLAEVAETDAAKDVRQAGLNALVALGKPELAREAMYAVRERKNRDLKVKVRPGGIWEAGQTMCDVLAMTVRQRRIGAQCR